jgi:hypothetical protein
MASGKRPIGTGMFQAGIIGNLKWNRAKYLSLLHPGIHIHYRKATESMTNMQKPLLKMVCLTALTITLTFLLSLGYAEESVLQAAEIPENGEAHFYITSDDGLIQIETEPVAKKSAIEITAPSGDDYYLVTLADPVTFQKQIVIFVYPGETVMVEIPSGEYWLYYTYGQTWYGFENKFGPAASRSRTEVSDQFEDGYYWSYTLYAVADGNISTETVLSENYPD